MKRSIKAIAYTPIILLGTTYCTSGNESPELRAAKTLLAGQWEATCQQNQIFATDVIEDDSLTEEEQDIGYFKETLLIDGNLATQTFDYFEDPECNIAVSDLRVSTIDGEVFLQQQSLDMSIGFPFGTTETALGSAKHINFTELSVALDGATLSDEELEQRGIVLGEQIGLFVVTESDHLHLGVSTEGPRPTTVPDSYYIRSANQPKQPSKQKFLD